MEEPATQKEEYTLKEFCSLLSISEATGRNWIKLGKIQPAGERSGKPYFFASYAKEVKERLKGEGTNCLKSRRNKKYISGTAPYKNYIPQGSPNLKQIEAVASAVGNALLKDSQIRAILAECAIQLLCQAQGKNVEFTENFLLHYSKGEIGLGEYSVLVQELLAGEGAGRYTERQCLAVQEEIPGAFCIPFVLERNVDILGMLYISLKNMGERKAAGSYYTPTHIVQKLIAQLFPEGETKRKIPQGEKQQHYSQPEEKRKVGAEGRKEEPLQKFLQPEEGDESKEEKRQQYLQPIENKGLCAEGLKKGQPELLPKKSITQLKILDPCCGTGNFLLQLPDCCSMEQVFGSDIDPISILAARINLALKFQDAPVSLMKEQIRIQNFLLEEGMGAYGLVLGNPPWGYQFGREEEKLLKQKFQTARGQHPESYDVFLEQALASVPCGGTVAFVLPEAVLHVKTHLAARRILLGQAQIERLEYLGDVFDKVQCPAVLLQVKKEVGPFRTRGMSVSGNGWGFEIQANRKVDAEYFNFHMTDREYSLMEKAVSQEHMVFLKNQADFALGIVTGNNKALLKKKKEGRAEPVLKGADIQKYRVAPPKCFLAYEPENFQQCAKESYYRAKEKLLYRFIGSQLVFAYDNQQRLSLNSCNVLIPHVPGMDMKYIMAVLNSRTAQFLYSRKFHSLKVLRTYLEQIPIPVAKGKQPEIISLTEAIMEETDPDKWLQYYHRIDRLVAAAYGYSGQEYKEIQNLVPMIPPRPEF